MNQGLKLDEVFSLNNKAWRTLVKLSLRSDNSSFSILSIHNTNNQESLDKEGELSASIKTLSRYIKNI
jgi:hypothetical protein